MNRRGLLKTIGGAFAAFVLGRGRTIKANLTTEQDGALHVRRFVADEVRTGLGEKYWAQGYGVLGVDLRIPDKGERVIVWCDTFGGPLEEDDNLLLRYV